MWCEWMGDRWRSRGRSGVVENEVGGGVELRGVDGGEDGGIEE